MKRNFRYILILMTVAIVGILIFQVYWISNTYDLESRSFYQEINEALEIALKEDLKEQTLDKIFGVATVDLIGTDAQDNLIVEESPLVKIRTSEGPIFYQRETQSDSHIQWLSDSTVVLSHTGKTDITSVKTEKWNLKLDENEDAVIVDPMEIGEVFKDVVITMVDHQLDLESLGQKYKHELSNRGISIPFNLALFAESVMVTMDGDDQGVFDQAQAKKNVPGRYNQGEYVMAFFPKTNSLFLKRMWLTLLGSFLLVSLVGGSFLLMLQMIIKQKKISEIKNDFINNMTHEFKTPIATVSAAMEAMVSFDGLTDKERSLRYIDISKKEIDRLSGLVEKVLSISAFEQQELILNKETFDLCQLVHEIAEQYILKGAGAYQIDFSNMGSAYLHADKMHFQNVVNNLIDNAVKYSSGQVKIEIICKRENEFVVLRIKDHGFGISKEQQKHIFEKFYRVPTGDLHSVKGFGLGLSYVKHIVELHGGTVGVQSQLGQGAEFIIAIPDIHE